MLKKYLFWILFCLNAQAYAYCKTVYTIGAYEEAFAKHAIITKLGPLTSSNLPSGFPKTFLEKNGSYGGGEAFCTVKAATRMLKRQLAAGVLPPNEHWHIYILDADWNRDVYKLKANDFRLKHAVKVLTRSPN